MGVCDSLSTIFAFESHRIERGGKSEFGMVFHPCNSGGEGDEAGLERIPSMWGITQAGFDGVTR